MKVSLEWINELVDIKKIKLEDLIEKLTFGGFEVEEVLKIEVNNKKEIILDISTTANRSDSLSIQGIAMEIAALFDKPMINSNYSIKSEKWKKMILEHSINFSPDENCSMIISMVIENVTNRNIPKWITHRLISSGFTTYNNLLDFQNYILLETGYPFLFYDFQKISSELNSVNFDLSISKANRNQTFLAANNQTYSLNPAISLITANNIPISIAGIIEDQKFSYSDSTNSLFIEGSVFSAAKIRQQSRILGIRTDRSTRYEKSLKNTYLIDSYYRLISLLRIANPNLSYRFQTIQGTVDQTLPVIQLRYKKIHEILGPISKLSDGSFEYIPPKLIENYLSRLNFQFQYDGMNEIWEVQIPIVRAEDLKREIDLIEEIGRLHGFNNFLIDLPKLRTIGIEDKSYKIRKKITSSFLNLGLNEFIHYSLVNEKTALENPIQLINPLSSDYSSLRTSLLPSLLQTIQDNLNQGNSITNGFEYGHIFLPNDKSGFQEKEYIAGVLGGFQTKSTWSDNEIELTWFEAKGKIEQFFSQLNILVNWTNKRTNRNDPILHPYRSATLLTQDNLNLGRFGQLHPILASQLNISSNIYLFEFDLEILQIQIQKNPLTLYQEYTSYPKIVKDISFIVKQNVSFQNLQKVIHYNGTNLLSEIQLIDEYKGESIPESYTSLCLKLVFKSTKKTLQTKEVDKIIENIKLVLTNAFDITIRD